MRASSGIIIISTLSPQIFVRRRLMTLTSHLRLWLFRPGMSLWGLVAIAASLRRFVANASHRQNAEGEKPGKDPKN
jgi:hypothetical protein